VKCSQPVPPNAHWKHRDRHVCSPRCNTNLSRQFNRHIRDRKITADLFGRDIAAPERLADPRTSGPRHFRTVPEQDPPYEFEGFGPRPGDTVERHGITCTYDIWHRQPDEQWHPDFPDTLHVTFVLDSTGQPVHLRAGNWGSAAIGQPLNLGHLDNFTIDGIECAWGYEFISDVAPDGREYRWEATIAIPVGAPHKVSYWTPARTELSERRRRESSNASRHARRVRVETATIERFDPHEVYERDGWICALCREPVNRAIQYPDPMCASLDHTLPLGAGGEHSRANTQLAHWLCNVRKGARTESGLEPVGLSRDSK